MSSTDVPQVKAYLAELERALSALPRDRRSEVMRDIRAHIGGALADGDASPAMVASVLDSLGTPQEIAEAAYEEMPPHGVATWPGGRGMAGRDIAAVILLLVGGFLFLVGWFVGVVLLWTSPAWRARDKWIGTLLVPGGLAGILLFGGLAFSTTAAGPCATPATVIGAGVGLVAMGPALAEGVQRSCATAGAYRTGSRSR